MPKEIGKEIFSTTKESVPEIDSALEFANTITNGYNLCLVKTIDCEVFTRHFVRGILKENMDGNRVNGFMHKQINAYIWPAWSNRPSQVNRNVRDVYNWNDMITPLEGPPPHGADIIGTLDNMLRKSGSVENNSTFVLLQDMISSQRATNALYSYLKFNYQTFTNLNMYVVLIERTAGIPPLLSRSCYLYNHIMDFEEIHTQVAIEPILLKANSKIVGGLSEPELTSALKKQTMEGSGFDKNCRHTRANMVKRNSALSIIDEPKTMDDLGGFDVVKKW